MELKPFKEMIAMSREKLDVALAPIRAKMIQSKADLAVSKLDDSILTKETQVEEMCTEKDLNIDSLIDQLDNIALLNRRREQITKVIGQLFPKK